MKAPACERCAHVVKTVGVGAQSPENPEGMMLNCRRYPPQAHVMMAQVPKTPSNMQGVMPVPMSFYPPVAPSHWCGEFAQRTS